MTASAPFGLLAALILAVAMWMAMLGAPRPEADPQRILSDEFSTSKAGVATALREHMDYELKVLGLRPVTYHLDIQFTPRSDGDHDIALTWVVYENGAYLGTVQQKNVFPYWVGANNKSWEAAAAAGAKGFERLLKDEAAK